MTHSTIQQLALAFGLAATLSTAVHGAITVVPQAEWGDMKTVAFDNSAGQLVYEFTVTPDQPLTISASFVASDYIPGAYDPGAVTAGWLVVRRQSSTFFEGNVAWIMAKPYTVPFNATHTAIQIGDTHSGTEVADYQPGATYQTTMTWNRAAGQIDIRVFGAGLDVSRTVASSGDTITGLMFTGTSYPAMGASAFGQVSVITAAVPEAQTWALMLAGLVAVGGIVRRHRPPAG